MSDDTNTMHGYDVEAEGAIAGYRWGVGCTPQRDEAILKQFETGMHALATDSVEQVVAYVKDSGLPTQAALDSIRATGKAYQRLGMSPEEADAELKAMRKDPETLAAYGNAQHPKHDEVHQRHRDLMDIAHPVAGR